MNPEARHVLVVDDHAAMRSSIAAIIDRTSDLRVRGEAATVAEALPFIAAGSIDLILTDLGLPPPDGFSLIERVAATGDIPVLVLSMHSAAFYAERAIRSGAAGYVMKGDGGDALIAAMRTVLAGGVYVSARIRNSIRQHFGPTSATGSNSPFPRLTEIEMRIFSSAATGEPDDVTAERLCLSVDGLRSARAAVCAKLKLANTAALRHVALLCQNAPRLPA